MNVRLYIGVCASVSECAGVSLFERVCMCVNACVFECERVCVFECVLA